MERIDFSDGDIGTIVRLVINVKDFKGNIDYDDGSRVPYEMVIRKVTLSRPVRHTPQKSPMVVDTSNALRRVDSMRVGRGLGADSLEITGRVLGLYDEYVLIEKEKRPIRKY